MFILNLRRSLELGGLKRPFQSFLIDRFTSKGLKGLSRGTNAWNAGSDQCNAPRLSQIGTLSALCADHVHTSA